MTMTWYLAGVTLDYVVHSSANDGGIARSRRLRPD
jgi:hypothetical protein